MILRIFLSNLLASLDMTQGFGVNTDPVLVSKDRGWDRELKGQYSEWRFIRGVEDKADN